MFLFLTRTQWILVGVTSSSCVLVTLIIVLFYRFYCGYRLSLRALYKAQNLDDVEEDEDEFGGATRRGRVSIVDHCYHHAKESILSQLDKEIIDEIHGSVVPEYDHHDIDNVDINEYNDDQRQGHYRGNVDNFLPNMMDELPKELMMLKDGDEDEDEDGDENESDSEEEEESYEEEEQREEVITDLSDSGSVRV